MMLADYILGARDTIYDVGGALTNIGKSIQAAHRFEASADIMRACLNLMQTKPSNLLKTLPLCRLPYPKMWIEANGGFSEHNTRDPKFAPIPALQGSLVESFGDQSGVVTVCWVHKDREAGGRVIEEAVNCTPFSVYFDWAGNAAELVRAKHREIAQKAKSPVIDMIVEAAERRWLSPMDDEGRRNFMLRRRGWTDHANNPAEVEALRQHELHMVPGISPHCVQMIDFFSIMIRDPAKLGKMIENWEHDIEGEGPFIEFFLAMLNSRNCVEREPIDLRKLNKAREKRGKSALLDYTKVKLVLSRSQGRAARAAGIDRQGPGLHSVRGHFKVRKTGVYWWHDFERGDPTRPAARTLYAVE